MSPWGCEVDDHRFGLLLSVVSSIAGGKWQQPTSWFVRSKEQEEERKNKDKAAMAAQALARFKALSAAQQAKKKADQ